MRVTIASLNIKGRTSGDLEKWYHVPQFMREKRIGILAVQETHLTEEIAENFERMYGNNLKLIHSPDPASNNAKGVAFVLNKKLVPTDDVSQDIVVPGRVLVISIPWKDNATITALNIYAPNIPQEARIFWREVQDGLRWMAPTKPNVMLGDFNLVEDTLDRIPSGTDDPQTAEHLKEVRTSLNMIDGWRRANEEEKGYTWSRTMDGTQSRIDRIYVHESMFTECTNWELTHTPIPTDHDMVSAKISMSTAPVVGRGRWAVPPRLMKQQRLRTAIQEGAKSLQRKLENMGQRKPWRNPQTLLKDFKTEVRCMARDHERKNQPMIANKIASLTEQLRATLNNPDQPEEETRLVSIHLRKEIMTLVKQTHQYNRDKMAAINAVEGEKIGKTWSNRHKISKPRDTIVRLRTPTEGDTTEDPKRMAAIAAAYHKRIQHEGEERARNNVAERERILGLLRTRLSERSKDTLREGITEDDVRNAIAKTNREKAPGLDGIPIELWKSLDNQYKEAVKRDEPETRCNIVWVLTQVYKDIENHGTDPTTGFSKGCMTPIYKKKNPDDIANYRPITLLNTDYKSSRKPYR